jgi:hypothetical protein
MRLAEPYFASIVAAWPRSRESRGLRLGVLLGLASMIVQSAPPPPVLLPNASFEQAGAGRVDSYSQTDLAAAAGEALMGLPDGWAAYQWGPQGSRFRVAVEKGVGHSGAAALRLQNLDSAAKGGVYAHPRLEAGTYQLAVWARTAPGKTGRLAMYLASAYSPPLKVTETWTRLVFENAVDKPVERAEINLQNASGEPSVVWVDDVELLGTSARHYETVADSRPERPRTLLFSPMNANYLRDTAKLWAERGFRGFLFDGMMASWGSDVWAVDGDPKTQGEDDGLYREVKACNDECRRYGIDSNFVKVAFYGELPDWFDDAAWVQLAGNFRQGTRFARLTGCVGVAIDTEYVAAQYDLGWAGYAKTPRAPQELKAKARERWRTVVAGMLEEFPALVLLTLPEGMIYYGPLYNEVFAGMLQACADVDAPNGLHVLTEGTYHLTAPSALAKYPGRVTALIDEELPGPLADYWRRRCSVAMGAWPLGYYRTVTDPAGKSLGYAGKKEIFGDKVIGSYADKSEWYTPAVFKEQMAGLNTFCPRYNWIYGHGCVFWQWTEAELKKYQSCAHRSASNATLPTVTNLAEYTEAIAKPLLLKETGEE